MRTVLVAICTLIIGAALGAGGLWLHLRGVPCPKTAAELTATPEGTPPRSLGMPPGAGHESQPAEPPRLSHNPAGETVVRLDTETQKRVGLKTAALVPATQPSETMAFGILEPDPSQGFTLRAPVAGVLRAADATNWPFVDQPVDAGTLLGYVEPRLTQTERIDLAARLTQARADAAEAEAALATARSSYENKRKLNAEAKAVSDRALEEALTKVKSEEARLAAARQIVQLIESAQSGAEIANTRFELRLGAPGVVVDAPAVPGEAVEAGQILLRTDRFEHLLARVELPIGEPFDHSAGHARIVLAGDPDHPLPGRLIGPAPDAPAGTHGTTLLYEVPTAGRLIRPGTPVLAYIPAPGGVRTGVAIPRAAVIRLVGKSWAYVRTDEEAFTRRELSDAHPMDETWFAIRGFQPEDQVVTDGAQVLLSEELKAQIEREEAASE